MITVLCTCRWVSAKQRKRIKDENGQLTLLSPEEAKEEPIVLFVQGAQKSFEAKDYTKAFRGMLNAAAEAPDGICRLQCMVNASACAALLATDESIEFAREIATAAVGAFDVHLRAASLCKYAVA